MATFRGLFKLAAAGLTIWQLVESYRSHQASKKALTPPAPKAAPENTWESEGGALPKTGAQLGPAPSHT